MKNLATYNQYTAVKAKLRHQLMIWLAAMGDNLLSQVEELPPAGTIIATGQLGP